MTLNAYLNSFRPVKRSNRATSWNAWDISKALLPVLRVSRRNNVASAVESSIEHPWRRDFRDSKFHNVPRCLDPQKRAPLVRVPKPPTIHYQPAIEKLFDSPASASQVIAENINLIIFLQWLPCRALWTKLQFPVHKKSKKILSGFSGVLTAYRRII